MPELLTAAAPAVSLSPQPARVESLESRRMLSVSTDAAGWTVVTPPADARVVYVSNSRGDDANSGLSAGSPVKSLTKATSLLRNKSADQMLLMRGDTWKQGLGTWTKSGRSAAEPLLIGAYGEGARPTLATGASTAFSTGLLSAPNVSYVVLQNLRLYADTRDPASATYSGTAGKVGVSFTSATDGFLIEGCEIDGYTNNITINKNATLGPIRNFTVRRSIITDAYNVGGNSQGLFAHGVDGITLEDNVFDHNGWNTAVGGAGKTMYNHNIYLKESLTNVVVRGNLISNASSHGMQARAGGTIENNTFLNNPIHLSFGLVNGGVARAGGVTGAVRNNVFLGGGSIGTSPRGQGMEVANIRPGAGAVVENNVFAHNPGGSGFAINLEYGSGVTNASQAVGINDLTVRNNVVYDWFKGFKIWDGMAPGGTGEKAVNRLKVSGNHFQRTSAIGLLWPGSVFNPVHEVFSGNRYDSAAGTVTVSSLVGPMTWVQWSPGRETGGQVVRLGYPEPTRTAASFAGELGGTPTDAGFVALARGLTNATWRPWISGGGLAAYVRAGFGR